jgi:hypothetical protein
MIPLTIYLSMTHPLPCSSADVLFAFILYFTYMVFLLYFTKFPEIVLTNYYYSFLRAKCFTIIPIKKLV